MKSKYVIRLDDACPTMDRNNWKRIETLLDIYRIKPIVAVIPDNKDKALYYSEDDTLFWDKIRSYQNKAWDIGMHGHNHVMHSIEKGTNRNNYSEFVGLPYKTQAHKINEANQIFKKEQVTTSVFIAPAHSIDHNTLVAITGQTCIRIISDGLAFNVYKYKGFYWIPQQLSYFRKLPFGLWSICLHPSNMKEKDFEKLEHALNKYRNHFISLSEVVLKDRKRQFIDKMLDNYLRKRWH